MAETGLETQKDKENYSGTVSSRGMVRAKSDRYLGSKYSYGSVTSKIARMGKVAKTAAVRSALRKAPMVSFEAGNKSAESIAKAILKCSSPNRILIVHTKTAREAERTVKAMTLAQEKLLAKGYGVTVTPAKQTRTGNPIAYKLAIELAEG